MQEEEKENNSSLLMRISKGIVPPGGWIYQEEDGIYIYGQTWDELLTNAIGHRASNGKSLDDVAKEIEDQIAEKFPKLIINGDYSVKKK